MNTRSLVRFVLGASLVMLAVFARNSPTQAQFAPIPAPLNMCEGASSIPNGYVTTNEGVNQACSYPGISGRMLTVESYLQAQKNGTQMTVCADAAVPAGFIVLGFSQSPGRCNLLATDPNATAGDHMVKTIRYPLPISGDVKKKKKPTQ